MTRKEGQPIIPPEPGEDAFLNPRVKDPLDFMELDLSGTFFFQPIGEPSSQAYKCAEFTIDVLRLNDRDYLLRERQGAYGNYKARLAEYIRDKDLGKPQADLDKLVQALKKMGHPTVWAEMKRQYALLPQLKALFDQAPEALQW